VPVRVGFPRRDQMRVAPGWAVVLGQWWRGPSRDSPQGLRSGEANCNESHQHGGEHGDCSGHVSCGLQLVEEW
jgi:hypothetical protein